MASVSSQLIEEVTAHAQSESLEDAREIRADGTYFPNNLRSSYRAVYTLHVGYKKCTLKLYREIIITACSEIRTKRKLHCVGKM